jgi:phosphomannomutase / phosphoglucomutase
MSIYKACDIRGKYGSELTEEHSARLACALRTLYGSGPVLAAGDGRVSTPSLKAALVRSLSACGFDVVDLGIVPTPLFYFARQALGVAMGVMVTASHNPAGDNGFKLTTGPLPITTDEMSEIQRLMEAGPAGEIAAHPGTVRPMDLMAKYLHTLQAHISRLDGMKVAIDCAHGMAGLAARPVWQKTGADFSILFEDVDGRFPAHAPNPAESKNLAQLSQRVLEAQASLGVAYDGDADRVIFVDELGRPVSGDQAIVLFAREILAQGPQTIVYDQKCSRIVPDTVRALGGTPVMELSGHTFIKRAFLTHSAAYAGELSGHHFFKNAGGDDALAASLFFARMVKDSGTSLSEMLRTIPVYPITPDLRIPMQPGEIASLLDRLESGLTGEASLSRTDGLRIEFPDSWGLVRPSVTEPVVTMRFEGVNEAALSHILARVQAVAPGLRGKLPG